MFISFEGIDGAGKSSHVVWVAERLRAQGRSVVVSREPGGTPLGEQLRKILLSEPMDINTELLLMTAARREHLTQVIEPALARGDVVLCDRFHDSSFAFQGGGRGVPAERIAALDSWCGGVRPDLTILFDVPVVVAEQRMTASRSHKDKFEQEAAEFHSRVRDMYHQRAAQEPGRIRIVDSTQSMEAIRQELVRLVN